MWLLQWRGWARWIWFLLGWTLLSLVFVPEVYLYFLYRGETIPWTHAVAMALANAAIAFMFLPPIVWLTRRWRIDRQTWQRSLVVHVPACLVFALSHSGLYALLCYASPSLFHALFVRFHPNLLTYWAIVGFTQAIDYFDRYRDREHQLAQAELLLMKAQLHPHFLFNTLNTIAAMMREDVEAADAVITRLSALLRTIVDSIGVHEIPLRQELDFIRNYAAIEQSRYGDRLDVSVSAEPEVLDALVPTMVLQPLVENAIRHGVDLSHQSGRIEITAARAHHQLCLSVTDNGPGPTGGTHTHGVGLANTRLRLRELYGDAQALSIESVAGGGCRARILQPFRALDENAGEFDDDRLESDPRDRGRRRAVGAPASAVAAGGGARL